MKMLRIIGFLVLTLTLPVVGQNRSSSNLEKVKQEITDLEKKLHSNENRERTIRETMEDLNRKIGLRRRLIYKLEQEKAANLKNIQQIEASLASTTDAYNKRRDLISKRFIAMYKKGRQSDWEVILSLSNVHQFTIWMKYQKMVIENDKRNIRLLKKQEESIIEQRDLLRKEQAKKEWLIREAADEQKTIEKDKAEEKTLLASVQQDKKALQEQIKRKERAYEQIKKLIASGEKNRKRSSYQQIDADFNKLKNKMNWPVQGRIISRYGHYQNKEFKVDESNIGIDIEASEADVVEAVCKGRIEAIQWQRGLGNIVVVDHGQGYYTVYGRLNVVLVNQDEDIEMGTILGQVGSKNSLYGSQLHFQIWKGEDSLNPADWLQK